MNMHDALYRAAIKGLSQNKRLGIKDPAMRQQRNEQIRKVEANRMT